MSHDVFIHRCLELAERGRCRVGNGAMVGAVLVRDGRIIAEGWHQGFGCLHAERMLLQTFAQKMTSNDILYINLEPCCHHGKTPPCTELIVERGIRRVIVGMQDPDPRVAGQGIVHLRLAGIDVIGPVIPELCERFNRGFVSLRTMGRPWITLKQARAPDGGIAHSDGSPLKITSRGQDIWSHSALRALHEAILIGVGTIISDDPILNTRLCASSEAGQAQIQPWRIVLDPHLRIPPTARVVTDGLRHRTIVVAAPDADALISHTLRDRGVRVVEVPLENNHFAWDALWALLCTPAGDYHGLTGILLEGGERTWGIFRGAGMVDEEVTLVGRG